MNDDELFDLELAATRAGHPPTHNFFERRGDYKLRSEADRAYVVGWLRAVSRDPDESPLARRLVSWAADQFAKRPLEPGESK